MAQIRMLQTWNGYGEDSLQDFGLTENARLVSIGYASNDIDGPAGEADANSSAFSGYLSEIGGAATFPLPINREIASAGSIDLAASSIPVGVTVTEEDEPDEFGGRVIKIATAGAVGTKEIILQFKSGPDYPVAFPQIAWRLKYGANFDRIYMALQEDTLTNSGSKRYNYWPVNSASASQFGNTCGLFTATKWLDQYRTYWCDRWFKTGDINAPVTWNENNPEVTIKAVRITIITTAAATMYFSRVYCPEWDKPRITINGDGGYSSFFTELGDKMLSRGWRGCLSRRRWPNQDGGIGDDTWFKRYRDAGWDITTHLAKDPINGVAVDPTATAAEIRFALANSRQLMAAKKLGGPGQQWTAFLQNADTRSDLITNMGSLLNSLGVKGSRGAVIDDIYGVDPFQSGGRSGSIYYTGPQHYIPLFGRYNRGFVAGGGNTPTTKDSYSGSPIESAIKMVVAAKQWGYFYFHRFEGTFDSPPPDSSNTTRYARDLLAALDVFVANGGELVTVSDIENATYDRPGDIYLRWDGEWVSRATGKIAF